jgi:signal peptidase I
MATPTAAQLPDKDAAEGDSAWSTLRFILTLAILAWAVRSFVAAPFSIPSGSMLPTLYIGDYLLVGKWPYGYSRYSFPLGVPAFDGRVFAHLPRRGDVVVFRHPGVDEDLIKRVIGLPGDTVAVRGGAVILNGRPLARAARPAVHVAVSANSPCKTVPPAVPNIERANGAPECVYNAWREMLPGGPSYTVLDQVPDGFADNWPTARVPVGHVFLMGDNRDDSLDSRFSSREGGIGMVPVDHLIGRAMVTFWSTDGSASYWKPWTWFSALRADRIGNGYAE